MNKKTLIENLMRHCKGASFCKRKDLADFLGYADAHRVDRYLSGLEHVGNGQYYIPDVVERLLGG